MTEAEWLTCENPEPLLCTVRGEVYPHSEPVEGKPMHCSSRKVALFTRALCFSVPYSPLNQPTLRGMEMLDQFASGLIALTDLIRSLESLRNSLEGEVDGDYFPFWETRVNEPYGVFWIARKTAIVTAWHLAREAIFRFDPKLIEERDPNWKTNGLDLPEWQAAHRQTRARQADLFRDIVHFPFRPVAFDPAWRTDTVRAITQGMYESRDFGAMPILADALQDAGCDNDDVLNHCCDETQVHVRGCWVVDLILGKE